MLSTTGGEGISDDCKGDGKRMLTLHHTAAFGTTKIRHIGNIRSILRRFPNKIELRSDGSLCRKFLGIPQFLRSGMEQENMYAHPELQHLA